MTREELERRVRMLIPLAAIKRAEAERTADALIRLAVEACCDDLKTMPGTSSQLPLFRDGFNHGVACAVARLRATFLPKDPSNG